MPSGTAYRPGDVITMFDGKRVEVLNTDAEGRMILGDAIARACADGSRLPARDLDADRRPGDRAGQADRRRDGHAGAVRAGPRRPATRSASRPGRCRCRTTCARAWTPTSPTSRRSTPAWTGPGTCCRAACSCASSSPTACAWAHIDIAGPGYHSGEPTGYWTKGGTGVPVRTLLQLVERHRRQRLTVGCQALALDARRACGARCSRASAAGSRPAARRTPGCPAGGRTGGRPRARRRGGGSTPRRGR